MSVNDSGIWYCNGCYRSVMGAHACPGQTSLPLNPLVNPGITPRPTPPDPRWTFAGVQRAALREVGEAVCVDCRDTRHKLEAAEQRLREVEGALREARSIAGNSGHRGQVGPTEIVTIQFDAKQWKAFQETVFAAVSRPVPAAPMPVTYCDHDPGLAHVDRCFVPRAATTSTDEEGR